MNTLIMLKTKSIISLSAALALLALCLCGCSKDEFGSGRGKLTVTLKSEQTTWDVPVSVYPYCSEKNRPIMEAVIKKRQTSVSFILNAGDYLISVPNDTPKAVQVQSGQEVSIEFNPTAPL